MSVFPCRWTEWKSKLPYPPSFRMGLFGIYHCKDMGVSCLSCIQTSTLSGLEPCLVFDILPQISGFSRIPQENACLRVGQSPCYWSFFSLWCWPLWFRDWVAASLNAFQMHFTISLSFYCFSGEAHSGYPICYTLKKGNGNVSSLLFTTNSLSVWWKAWLPGAPQMHYCTDRIIEKRLISGFEYSNDRKGTQVSLAWVRFTPVMQLL